MREKIIIWGTGNGYLKRKSEINLLYDIIAFTDNKKGKASTYDNKPYIEPIDIKNMSYDKIIVCSIKYFETIKYQLITSLKINSAIIQGLQVAGGAAPSSIEETIFDTVAQYRKTNKDDKFPLIENDMWLICEDYGKEAGLPMEHYFAQDIWGAKKIYESMPDEHFDIGSRLDGFISHLLVFMNKVTYIDIRPLPMQISKLFFIQGNATNLCNINSDTLCSLSSFHALEHFGLGRYGDSIDPDAWKKALKEFERVLKKNGKLYLGVPIGSVNKLVFNAHRIFSPNTIIDSFSHMKLLEFSIIKNNEFIFENISLDLLPSICKTIPEYSCGLFEFIKV